LIFEPTPPKPHFFRKKNIKIPSLPPKKRKAKTSTKKPRFFDDRQGVRLLFPATKRFTLMITNNQFA